MTDKQENNPKVGAMAERQVARQNAQLEATAFSVATGFYDPNDKYIPPNPTLLQFMLKHRVPRYSDEKEIDDKIVVKFEFDEAIEEFSK